MTELQYLIDFSGKISSFTAIEPATVPKEVAHLNPYQAHGQAHAVRAMSTRVPIPFDEFDQST